jgi:hypothetical protein
MRALSLLLSKSDLALAVPPAAMLATPPISWKGVFTGCIMASVAYVTLPIPRLVSVEVVEPLLPALRQRSSVTVLRIIAVVDVAVKAVMAVKPGASRREHSYREHSRSTHRDTREPLQRLR